MTYHSKLGRTGGLEIKSPISMFRRCVSVMLFPAMIMISWEAQATQILVNPGFETGALAPWVQHSGSPFVTNLEAHTGTYSVSALGPEGIRQDFAPIPTSNIMEISMWLKRIGGPFNQYQLLYDDTTATIDIINAIGTGDDWQFFDITSQLDAGKNLIGFVVAGTTPGPAFLDDFTIEVRMGRVPEPTTLLLLGLGIAGLGFARKRLH